MKKEIIIILIAIIIASLTRGIILFYTEFSFSIWKDKFDLIPLLLDFMIWALSYVSARVIITNLLNIKFK